MWLKLVPAKVPSGAPRLDQLLELAAEAAAPVGGRWLSFIQGAGYGFTAGIRYSGGRTVGQEMRGGTPEEAVANWLLLARAGEVRA